MSQLLLWDIYTSLLQLWASPSSTGSKVMFHISNSHLYTSQKCSHTIQRPLNCTRTLAATAQLLNVIPARGKRVNVPAGWNATQCDIWGRKWLKKEKLPRHGPGDYTTRCWVSGSGSRKNDGEDDQPQQEDDPVRHMCHGGKECRAAQDWDGWRWDDDQVPESKQQTPSKVGEPERSKDPAGPTVLNWRCLINHQI